VINPGISRLLIVAGLFGISATAMSQVNKPVLLNSVPEGALVTSISGRTDFLGNTPLKHTFGFHSEISVLKLKLSACGFYDTIIKINPQSESLMIRMDKKKFLILPETEKDVFPENEKKLISSMIVDFLNDFSIKNIKNPINFMDFAVMKHSSDGILVNITFELDPEYLQVSRGVKADSVLKRKWEEWFDASLKKLKPEKQGFIDGMKIYFSVISGKKNISIRYLPGVDVRDEFKSDVSVYEGDNKRVTTVTYYYETEVNPTFNTTLDQNQKYMELIYEVGKNPGEIEFSLKQKALISFTNGKLTTLFGSSPDLNQHSMLTRFLNKK
jgi:hypothetical protein